MCLPGLESRQRNFVILGGRQLPSLPGADSGIRASTVGCLFANPCKAATRFSGSVRHPAVPLVGSFFRMRMKMPLVRINQFNLLGQSDDQTDALPAAFCR